MLSRVQAHPLHQTFYSIQSRDTKTTRKLVAWFITVLYWLFNIVELSRILGPPVSHSVNSTRSCQGLGKFLLKRNKVPYVRNFCYFHWHPELHLRSHLHNTFRYTTVNKLSLIKEFNHKYQYLSSFAKGANGGINAANMDNWILTPCSYQVQSSTSE